MPATAGWLPTLRATNHAPVAAAENTKNAAVDSGDEIQSESIKIPSAFELKLFLSLNKAHHLM